MPTKKTREYPPRDSLGGASTTGPLGGASILSDEIAADPTLPIRAALGLLEKTRSSFKSKDIAAARALLETWLAAVFPALPLPEVPDTPLSVRVDGELGRELAARGEVSGAAIKRDLLKFYRVLRDELAHLDHGLDAEHVRALCGYVRAADPHDSPAAFLAALEEAWKPHPRNQSPRPNVSTELLDRLRALSPAGLAAAVDAAQRFWWIYPKYEQDETRALQRVGLLRQAGVARTRTP